MSLKYEDFINDDRVQKGQEMILDALKEHQSLLKNVRGSQKLKEIPYQNLITQFSKDRGSDLWYPYIGSGFGKGALVELADGSVKYDFISGIGTHWGHSDPGLVEASIKGALQDCIIQGNLQQNLDSTTLLRQLLQASGMDHGVLTTSGAMANENALKIIFQNKYPADRILAFENCFKGRTLGLSSISDKPQYREGLPVNLKVDYVPFFDEKDPAGSTRYALQRLRKYIKRYPKQHAAMSFEMVQGEAGYYPGTKAFFETLMKELKKEGVLIMVDEVQTFARTPQLFAFQTFNLDEYVDLVTIGKLSQVCATLYRSRLKPAPGLVSQTFTSSSSAISSALYILNQLKNEHYLGPNGKISTISRYMVSKLEELSIKYPKILEGPFGFYSMLACTPFGGEHKKVVNFAKKLFENGLIVFIAGKNPTRIRFLLPIGSVTEQDIDEAIDIFEKVLVNLKEK